MSDLLTAKELAEKLRLNWQTVLKWKRQGKISAEIDLPAKVLFDEMTVRKELKKLSRKRPPTVCPYPAQVPTL